MYSCVKNNDPKKCRELIALKNYIPNNLGEYLESARNTEFADIWFEKHNRIDIHIFHGSVRAENALMCNRFIELDPEFVEQYLLTIKKPHARFVSTLNFKSKWKLYIHLLKLKAYEELDEFSDEENDLILNDIEKKPNKCLMWNYNLVKRNLETGTIDAYKVGSLNIRLENLPLLDKTKIQKRTKKATVIVEKPCREIFEDHFHKLEDIKSVMIQFDSVFELPEEERKLLQCFDCTFINPFYLYSNADFIPEKVIWKTNVRFPRPPDNLIPLFPEFEIYRVSNEMIDLKTQLKRANVLLKEHHFAELKDVLEPLYDYELSEDEEYMLRKPFLVDRLLYLPMIANPMVSHLITVNQTLYIHYGMWRFWDILNYEKIGKYLKYIPTNVHITEKIPSNH